MTSRSTRTADSRSVYLPVPHYPELTLVCTAPDRYPPELLYQLQQYLAQWQPAHPTLPPDADTNISIECMKTVLRSIHDPPTLARHPLADRYPDIPATERGFYLAACLTAAIYRLEQPVPDAERDMRGTILRMRYLECCKTRTIRSRLHLSERHYYRLQAVGLEWLATHLSTAPQLQEREQG
jgi:hypothetical protein